VIAMFACPMYVESAFALTPVALSNVQIILGSGEATATASYAISSQNGTVGGTIAVRLVSTGGGLGIEKITIRPRP
jgi:hypothetical protein